MFRFHKTQDIVTLFHKPSVSASARALTALKQASANAEQTATEDQASDHTHHNEVQRTEFQLDVTEEAPTPDQLKTILEYVGAQDLGRVVNGATSVADAVKKVKQSEANFLRPVVVDWNNGKAVVGGDESAIMKLLSELPKA